MVKRLILAWFFLWISTSAFAQIPAASTGGKPSSTAFVKISANLAAPGFTIPTNFVGFSFEVSDLVGGYFQGTTGSAASMLGMMQLLGTCGSVRIGGASSDSTPSAPALTNTIASNLQAFMGALGGCWQLFYGLDLKINNAATAATQAGLIATAFGASNVIFQFGNEPELYLTPANYITNWNGYYTTVSGAVAGLKVAAWDSGDFADTQTVIAGLTPGLAGMSYLTQHYYSDFATVGTIQHIFATLRAQNAYNGFYINNGYAGSKSIPQRMTETNSVDNGGLADISNTMGGSAWLILEQIILAAAGWSGVNIHGYYIQVPGFPANPQYVPMVHLSDGNFGPGASFYAMFMFSKIEGQQIVPIAIGGSANVAAIATKGSGGNANILSVNLDPGKSALVYPDQRAAWSTARVLTMTALDSSGCSSTNLIVGGAAIGESGSWPGDSVTINDGASVSIPPCGAALIQIQP
jgi:hypothetical protein